MREVVAVVTAEAIHSALVDLVWVVMVQTM